MYYSWPPQLKRLDNRCLRAWYTASPAPARDGAATRSSPPPQLSKVIDPEEETVLVGRGRLEEGTGEAAAALGSVFGYRTVRVRRRGGDVREPTDCQECGGPRPLAPDYTHRICPSCYSIIATQLWRFLQGNVTEQPAAVIWAFLQEKADALFGRPVPCAGAPQRFLRPP